MEEKNSDFYTCPLSMNGGGRRNCFTNCMSYNKKNDTCKIVEGLHSLIFIGDYNEDERE